MLKNGSFIKSRYLHVILPAAITYAFIYASTFIDLSLAGILYDEIAVSAIEIDLPVATIAYAAAGIFVSGAIMMIGKEKGKFNDKKADKLLGQTFLTAFVVGSIFSIIFYFGRDFYLSLFNCSPEVYELAKQYYTWIIPLPLIVCFRWVLVIVNEIDADVIISILSQVVSFFLHIAVSLLCTKKMGVAGLSFGTVIAMSVELFVLAAHFLRKTNTFKFGIQFDIKDALQIIVYGISEGSRYLLIAIVDFCINLFISYKFGDSYLCVYAIINLLTDIIDSFSCIPETGNAFGSIFVGEKNNAELKNIFAIELKFSIIIGIAFAIITICFRKQIPLIYGINSGPAYETSVIAVASIGLTSVVSAILLIIIGSFSLIGQVKTSLFATILHSLVMPLALPIAGSYIFGINGFPLGVALNPVFSILFCSIYLVLKYGFKGFPLYIKESDEKVYTCDATVNTNSVKEVCDFIEDKLMNNGIDKSLTLKIRLLCDELYTRIIESNKGNTIISECSLMIGPSYIRLIVRDDGVMKNYVDEDNKVESFNAYCLARLISNDIKTNYSFTNSFNRNGFVFYRF